MNRFFPNYPGHIITSPFGDRVHPMTGKKSFHNGIDLVATRDGVVGHPDRITAHTGGEVERVGYDETSGNYIRIRVSGSTVMAYCHFRDKPALKAGDAVKTGQVIGYMGKTGAATGPHLHFGIQKDGVWIDPAPYLDGDYEDKPGRYLYDMKLPRLEMGCQGEDVKALQQLLIAKGFSCGRYRDDGDFGADTEAALVAFQKAGGLATDGICGPATWSKLLGL